MEIKIGDKVRNNDWVFIDYVIVEWFKLEREEYIIAGINNEGGGYSGHINANRLEILPPEPEYSIVEEWERYWNGYYDKELGEPNNQWQWSQKTGRKFKKYADGRLELVEV